MQSSSALHFMMRGLVVLVLLPLWSTQAQDILRPNVDILGALNKITILEEKVNVLEAEMAELKRLTREQPKVAFTASLFDSEARRNNVGPYQEQVTVVYKNAFTNIGCAYNPDTGVFVAPVKGVYYFSLVAFNPYDHSTGLSLMKNREHVVSVSDNPPGEDTEDTASNAASLLLEKGDQVYIQLMENRKIYCDQFRRNTFSGHLLYTM